jgi:hypothetical protein
MNKLASEARKATQSLAGKTVKAVRRHRATEILVLFTDGTRLLVDHTSDGLEMSVADEFDGGIETSPATTTRH